MTVKEIKRRVKLNQINLVLLNNVLVVFTLLTLILRHLLIQLSGSSNEEQCLLKLNLYPYRVLTFGVREANEGNSVQQSDMITI